VGRIVAVATARDRVVCTTWAADAFARAARVAPSSRRLSEGVLARRAEGETPSGQPARCRRYPSAAVTVPTNN
jgi:hypothetical protein